jgi:hypothetical protein
MKFWQLQKLCLENAYTLKREGKNYHWKKNESNRSGICDTLIETAEEIKKDIDQNKNYNA